MKSNVPKFLKEHYDILTALVKQKKLNDAKEYLYNLPQDIYDAIIDRSCRMGRFASIVNKIESIDSNKGSGYLFKVNDRSGDDNFIF